MLGHFRERSHHYGEGLFLMMERAFLSAGAVLVMLVVLLVIYAGLLLLQH